MFREPLRGTYEARCLMAARFAKLDDEQRILALKKKSDFGADLSRGLQARKKPH